MDPDDNGWLGLIVKVEKAWITQVLGGQLEVRPKSVRQRAPTSVLLFSEYDPCRGKSEDYGETSGAWWCLVDSQRSGTTCHSSHRGSSRFIEPTGTTMMLLVRSKVW